MSIERLISYPKVPVFAPEFLAAFIDGVVSSSALFDYGKLGELRSTISVRLVENCEDPIFVVAEALTSVEDSFSKDVGKSIADGRAISRKEVHEDVNWTTFTLSEAQRTTEDYFEREEKGKVMMVSEVTLPITEMPLPHGIVNRLRMLIEK